MMTRIFFAIFALIAIQPSNASDALAQETLHSWETVTGQCGPSDIESLKKSSSDAGTTVIVEPAELYTASGLSPSQVTPSKTFPAMTAVSCHARDGNKLLVSSDEKDSSGFCGWVLEAKTLGGTKRDSASGDGNGLLDNNNTVCGNVQPLLVREYCKRLADFGKASPECGKQWVRDSPFQTKFLVWNTDARGKGTTESIEVPLYQSAEADTKASFRSVKVFNVLRVFDMKPGPNGTLRYLVGPSHTRLEGWIDDSAGTVWYSQLATFFSRNASKEVLFDDPSVESARPLVAKPDNITEMLDGKKEFRRFPVLVDNRERKPHDPEGKRPHLELAFIGAFCQGHSGTMCATNASGGGDVTGDPQILERADILFLIDATKSMSPYFSLVSRAVQAVAIDYKNSPDYQFGVSLYGDHTVKGRTQLDDDLQFRVPIELRPLAEGTEFDQLKDETLFLDDKQADLEEAPFAALLRAIETTPWRGDEPRFIIHVADAGDRIKRVPARVLKALQDKRIFYMPVAVRGSNDADINALFVDQSRQIFHQHRTPSGRLPMGVEVQVTYGSGSSVSAQAEYDGIAKALKAAVDLGKQLRAEIMNELLRRAPSSSSTGATSQSALFPAGYGKMLEAARELFGIKVNLKTSFPIASRGYVETAELGQTENNWEYFAAISPPDVGLLKGGFDQLCGRISDSNSAQSLGQAVSDVIKVLTGDEFKTRAEFQTYFAARDKIPLSTQTMLGAGLLELARDLNNTTSAGIQRVATYQREVCRTAVLLSVMNGGQRLSKPLEGQDIVWDENKKKYNYKNATPFDWVFKDDFGVTTTFLPLSYLPRAPRELQ